MKLSAAAELAVRGITVLAEHYGKGPVTLEAICSRKNLPKQYLTKIFSQLARVNLIMPVRGKGGGYMLGKAPSEITLLQVIEAIEGPIILNLCQHSPSQCSDESCRIRSVWSDLQVVVKEKLSSLHLNDCISK